MKKAIVWFMTMVIIVSGLGIKLDNVSFASDTRQNKEEMSVESSTRIATRADFTAYYCNNTRYTKKATQEDINKHWDVTTDENGTDVFTRTSADTGREAEDVTDADGTHKANGGAYGANPYPEMAMLYCNIGQYRDFTLEVEYRNKYIRTEGSDSTDEMSKETMLGGAWVGFDGKIQKKEDNQEYNGEPGEEKDQAFVWNLENCGTMIATDRRYSMRLCGSIQNNKGTKLDLWNYGIREATFWETPVYGIKDWGTKWNKIKIEAKNETINFYLQNDDGQWVCAWEDREQNDFQYGDWYDGGYIFLASNNEGTAFRNLKITGTTLEEEEKYLAKSKLNEAFYTANASNMTINKVDVKDYWNAQSINNEIIITRTGKGAYQTGSLVDGDVTKNMALLYYNVGQYKDFTMTAEVRNPELGKGGAYIGYNGRRYGNNTTIWYGENNASLFGLGGSNGVNMFGTFIPWDSSNADGKEKGENMYNTSMGDVDWGTEWNSIMLEVKNGVIKLSVKVGDDWKVAWEEDGNQDRFFYGDWYHGGYLFLASNNEGTQFKNIIIEGTPIDIDNRDYSCFYTTHSDRPAKLTWLKDYFTTDAEGVFTRTAKGTTTERKDTDDPYYRNPYPDMAALYYNCEKYKDFTLTVEYYNASDYQGGAFVGFGGKIKNGAAPSWKGQGECVMVSTYGANGVCVNGTFYEDGVKKEKDIVAYDETPISAIGKEWHTLKLEVSNGKINLYIDGKRAWDDGHITYGDSYEGGNIFLASNNAGTKFRNLRITEPEITIDGKTIKTDYGIFTTGDALYGYYYNGKIYPPDYKIMVTEEMHLRSVKSLNVVIHKGASIRTLAPAGIRFLADVHINDKKSIPHNQALKQDDEGYGLAIDLGMYIMPEDLYQNKYQQLTASSIEKDSKESDKWYAEGVAKVRNKGWFGADPTVDGYVGNPQFCSTLINMVPDNYERGLRALGYIKVNYTNGKSTIVWSDDLNGDSVEGQSTVRSLYQVASLIKATGDNGYYGSLVLAAKKFIDNVIAYVDSDKTEIANS